MKDEYERSAEFIDLMLAKPWTAFGPALTAVLDELRPGAESVVDVGAGGGHGTSVIARPYQRRRSWRSSRRLRSGRSCF